MKDKKISKKRRRYDADFKSNVLRLHADGRSVSSLSVSFGIGENLIYRWKSEAKKSSQETVQADQEEVIGLRKRVRELEEERDILKKALGIFSRVN